MSAYQKENPYAPLSLRTIAIVKVMLFVGLTVWLINAFNLPAGSALICITPLMLIAYNPEWVRYMRWQLAIGFAVGVASSFLFLRLPTMTWSVMLLSLGAWLVFWFYFGETADILLVPSRIIAIVPITMVNLVSMGQGAFLTQTFILLLLFSVGAVILFSCVDVLVFPMRKGFKPHDGLWLSLGRYLRHLQFNRSHLSHAVQGVLAVTLILSVNHWAGVPGSSAVTTALVTVAVISTSLTEKLMNNIRYRFLGNLTGGVLGVICLCILSTLPFSGLMFGLVLLCFALFTYIALSSAKLGGFALQAGFAYVAVDPMAALTGDLHSGFWRLFGVVYGCVAVYLSHLLLVLCFRVNQKSHQKQ